MATIKKISALNRMGTTTVPNGIAVSMNDVIDLGKLIADSISPYQREFEIFGHAEINNSNKVYHIWVNSSSRVFQAGGSCSNTPLRVVSAAQEEVVPCTIKLNTFWCRPDTGSSIVNSFLEYRDGIIDEARYQAIHDKFYNTIVTQMVQGRMLLSAAGNLYGGTITSYATKPGVDSNDLAQFNAMRTLCNGWLNWSADEMIAMEGDEEIVIANFANAGAGKYTGDILKVYDDLLADAAVNKPELNTFFQMGAVTLSDGSTTLPIALASLRLHQAVVDGYKYESKQATQNKRRFDRIEMLDANGRKQYGYTIDDVVVVPVSLAGFEDLVLGSYEFFILTIAGNIAEYDSFESFPMLDASGAPVDAGALRILNGDNFNEDGKTFVKGDAIKATVIGDLNLLTGTAGFIDLDV